MEAWVNGESRHELVRAWLRGDGTVVANCADLTAIGLRVPTVTADCALNQFAGLTATINPLEQRLVVTATRARLLPQIVSARGATAELPLKRAPDSGMSGFALTYDASVEAADLARASESRTLGTAMNLAAFGPWGAFRTDGFATEAATGGRAVRLDSTLTLESADSLRRVSIGDTVTGDLDWSRSVRIGGIQIASDFLLQPDLVTQPLPQFFGESALPSTMDVYVNDMKVFAGKIAPGPFEIRDLPVVTGANQVTLVTRDVLGRETLQSLALYASEQLLARGLTEYAIDAGSMREGYGLEDFGYGPLIATGTVRHGVSNGLTLEGHTELGAGVAQAGVGIVIGLSPYGTASLGLATSRSRYGSGFLGAAGFQSRFHALSVVGQLSATADSYRDIAAHDGAPPPELRAQFGGNLTLGRSGSLSASWVDLKFPGQSQNEFATANYSASLGSRLMLSLVGYRNLDSQQWGTEFLFTLALGKKTYGQVSIRLGAGTAEKELSVSRAADPYGGVGYNVSGLSGAVNGAEGGAIWTGSMLTANAGLSSVDGLSAARLGASGSLLAIDGDLHAARRIDGAAALVDAGRQGVRVYHENRLVAVTGENGQALVTGLVPYGRNTIGVSVEDYPMNVLVSAPERIVVPNRFGALVDLKPRRGLPVLVALQLPGGGVPKLGTRAALENSDGLLVVGSRGRLFIPHLPAPVRGHLLLSAGRCDFTLVPPAPRPDDSIPEIGPLACHMEKR